MPGRTGDQGVAASSEQLEASEKLRTEECETLVERTELGRGEDRRRRRSMIMIMLSDVTMSGMRTRAGHTSLSRAAGGPTLTSGSTSSQMEAWPGQ